MSWDWKVEFYPDATWVDITSDVRMVSTSRGRANDLDSMEAGTATVELDNSSGDYTPENTSGTYVSGGVSQILPGVPFRISLSVDGGTYVEQFHGFADSWPPSWSPDGIDTVTVELVDGFELLSSDVDYATSMEIRAGAPAGYWPVTKERQGNTLYDMFLESGTTTSDGEAIVSSGSGALTVVADSSEAGGAVTVKAPSSWAGTSNDVTFEAFVRWDEGTDPWFRIAEVIQGPRDGIIGGSSAPGAGWRFAISSPNGQLRLDVADWDGTITTIDVLSGSSLSWAKNTMYHVAFWWDQSAGQVTFYRNGATAGTDTTAVVPGGSASPTKLRVGRPQSTTGTWRISDVAIWPSDQSSLLSDISDSGDGFASDLPGARIGRLLDWAGWPSLDRNIDTGTTSLAAIEAGTVLTACQDAASADGGVFFIAKDGDARFQGRRERWQAEGAYTDLYDDTYTEAGPVKVFDDDGTDTPYQQNRWTYDTTLLHNAVTVNSNTQGVSDGYAEDATSIATYKRRTLSVSTVSNDTNDNLYRAQWELSRRKDPHLRLEELQMLVGRDVQESTAQLLELQDLVEVNRRPSGADAIAQLCRVASVRHDIVPKKWDVTFGLVEAETDQPGIYDSSVYDDAIYGY